ncbi:MAG TPA: peptidylprolyl isomerase [Burkholderiales bacterium]|nr:peptidylprolyl isomerase [Burkholderiales bacterium]
MHSLKLRILGALAASLLAVCVAGHAADSDADAKPAAETKPAEGKPAAKPKSTAAKPRSDQKNVAIVNGAGIPQARLDFVAKSQLAQAQQQQQGQPGQQPMQDTPEFRDNLREILITREILSQEAVRRKLDKSVEYQTQLDLAKQQIILAMLVEDMNRKLVPSDDDVRKEYERVKAERGGDAGKQYKSRHILVKEEDAAKQIIADLDAGGDFAAIAKEKSEDTGSKEEGGELDWSEAEAYVQPFGEALKKLNKGERTKEPVKTNYGYHIIELEDVRAVPFPEFEQVKPQITQQLATKMRDDYIASLRAKAKIQKIDAK